MKFFNHMNSFKLFVGSLLVITFAPFLMAGAPLPVMTPTPLKKALPIDSAQGYLLLNLNIGGTAPSFKIQRLVKGKLVANDKKSALMISLSGLTNGFYVIPLLRGKYQITEINAPYFNLPYRLDVATKSSWRLSILEQSINYGGMLTINKNRNATDVDISLLNRSAHDYQEILDSIPAAIATYSVTSASFFRDDVMELLR